MWHYMALQEGTLGVDPDFQKTNDGTMPPVDPRRHRRAAASDRDGRLITDKLWGLYYKPDFHFGGVQGGAMPAVVRAPGRRSARRSLRRESPEFVVDDNFARHVDVRARVLPEALRRHSTALYRKEPSGGIGCFTPDSFPVFDRFRENVYVIADSNHGYKMIGVGELVADELLGDQQCAARAVPLLALRRGQAAPGEQQPVSLELSEGLTL